MNIAREISRTFMARCRQSKSWGNSVCLHCSHQMFKEGMHGIHTGNLYPALTLHFALSHVRSSRGQVQSQLSTVIVYLSSYGIHIMKNALVLHYFHSETRGMLCFCSPFRTTHRQHSAPNANSLDRGDVTVREKWGGKGSRWEEENPSVIAEGSSER